MNEIFRAGEEHQYCVERLIAERNKVWNLRSEIRRIDTNQDYKVIEHLIGLYVRKLEKHSQKARDFYRAGNAIAQKYAPDNRRIEEQREKFRYCRHKVFGDLGELKQNCSVFEIYKIRRMRLQGAGAQK